MENEKIPDVFESLEQARHYMNTSRQGVWTAIKKGRLKSTFVNGRHHIRREDIEKYLATKFSPTERKFQGEKVYNLEEGEMSVEQVAIWLTGKLGKPCTTQHLYYLLHTGQLRGFKKGGTWVIKQDDRLELYEKKAANKKRQMTFAESS